MAIELSDLIFTDEDDIIPASGEDLIVNTGTTNTLAGNDKITGVSGFFSNSNSGIINDGIIDTGDGRDIITGNSLMDVVDPFSMPRVSGIYNSSNSIIDTGNDSDIIIGTGTISIDNFGTINTGNGEDSILSEVKFINNGGVFLGGGNDIITHTESSYYSDFFLENHNVIETGEGDDRITSPYANIYNSGIINTGEGDDIITAYNIYNNGGAINTGNGNDFILGAGKFESGPNSSGAWFLGEGDDHIAGFGSGDFYGGNGNDTLSLAPGTYTVGIWGEGGESLIFTKGDQLMITSEFEKLQVASTIYDFTSLTAGQIIVY
jgi:hypothetical protein